MSQGTQHSAETPRVSIVIPVYNDWAPLHQCLLSLARQTNAPTFEVIIVDDGSRETAPAFVYSSKASYPLTVMRQAHAGIPAARNLGVRSAQGAIVLFVDADCRLDPRCLAELDAAVSLAPQHDYFQLRLVGNRSNLVGRAEELRLATFQKFMLQLDGRIRFLNTAGFALRRARVKTDGGVFNPIALRAEDTLLLADLMENGQLPLFVAGAVVEHRIQLSLRECLQKDIGIVHLEGRAYEVIKSKRVKIRLTRRERLRMLWSMWKAAADDSIGRSAWFVVVMRQSVLRILSPSHGHLKNRVNQESINPTASLPEVEASDEPR
jgi:glycosyltransferase involved in cell wall biosynthesis